MAIQTRTCPKCNTPLLDFNVPKPVPSEYESQAENPEVERDSFAEVFDKEPVLEFLRFLGFLALLALPVLTVPLAILLTAFAGSGHGAPIWYYVFLLFTQAIPIVSFSMASVVSAFGLLFGKKITKALSITALSFVLYVLSFFVIFLIGSIIKAMTTNNPYGFLRSLMQ